MNQEDKVLKDNCGKRGENAHHQTEQQNELSLTDMVLAPEIELVEQGLSLFLYLIGFLLHYSLITFTSPPEPNLIMPDATERVCSVWRYSTI